MQAHPSTMSIRSRSWCWTLSNYTQADIIRLRDLVDSSPYVKYIIWQYELAPSTGTPHLQGFYQGLQDVNPKSLRQMKIILHPRAHLEKTEGSAAEAADYCKKEDTRDPAHSDQPFEEFGEKPQSNATRGKNERKRFADAFEAAQEGRMDDIPGDIKLRHYNTIKRIKLDHEKVPDRLTEMDFHLYTGSAGTGKSMKARDDNPEAYIKHLNKWWCNYQNEDVILIEEINPEACKYLGHYLKQWCDLYPFKCEYKGGSRDIRPKTIIFTSNYDLQELFGHDQNGLYLPMSRRITVHEFSKVNDEYIINTIVD